MLGIYIHLPFCPYLCPYCDFAKWPLRASAAQRYLRALYAEMAKEPSVPAATIFVGGGTPNAYEASTVAGLVNRVRAQFPSPAGRHEISLEINPELVREDDFARYREAGVTRLSIGVQSFEPQEIRLLGRKHSPEQVEAVVAAARSAGIRSVSLDLMFAIPGQTPDGWRRSLERAIGLGVDHISTYGLTVEPNTPFAAWYERAPHAFPDEAHDAALYELAMAMLQTAGYEHYEISNFARPGHRCAHNLNYWANGEYLGLGVGAASYRDGERSVHTRSLERYVEDALAGGPIASEAERLEGPRRIGEAIMLALRTAQGVRLGEFKERYDVDVATAYAPAVERFAEAGLLECVEDAVRLTARGRFVANDVCEAFLP